MVDSMTALLKADESGSLQIPAKILPESSPHREYEVSVGEKSLVVKPLAPPNDFWTKMSPDERAEAFRKWIEETAVPVGLSDYAVSRESIYED